MSNRRDNQFHWSPHNRATVLDCSFIVDSANGNALGIRSLKPSGRIASVNMYSSAGALPPGSPAMGTARNFAILGASAVSNTGSSVITGNLGIYPGTAVSGFPPGLIVGQEHVADVAAHNAQIAAQVAYTDLHSRASTVIATALDAQSLSPGVYSSADGTFSLAASAGGTLVLNGSPTSIFVFQTATTLVTGAGGIPVITLAGGQLASNVYWVVGSSATINSGSAGVFQGNIIAQASVTDTLGGTVNGSMIALTGAVTLSAATVSKAVLPVGPGQVIGAGLIVVRLQDNYNTYLGGYAGFASPLTGVNISISGSGVLVVGQPYVIVSPGSSSQANWGAMGLPADIVPAVGVSFLASAAGSGTGSGVVQGINPNGSGIDHIEVIGDSNLMNSTGAQVIGQGNGMEFILACYAGGQVTAPTDGTVIGLNFYMNNSAQGV
jgi:hypothetical protein